MTGSIPPAGPLAYEGQVAVPYVIKTYNPETTFNSFPIGTIWINYADSTAFLLVSNAQGVAVWAPIGGSPGQIETITTPDSEVVYPVNSNINFLEAGGITITGNDPASPDIKFTVTGGGFPWVDVTDTTQSMEVNTGYVSDNAALVTLTLPETAAFGDVIAVVGNGGGGWTIAQNSAQQILAGTGSTTAGVSGSVASTNNGDCIELLCVVADKIFRMRDAVGNLTLL